MPYALPNVFCFLSFFAFVNYAHGRLARSIIHESSVAAKVKNKSIQTPPAATKASGAAGGATAEANE